MLPTRRSAGIVLTESESEDFVGALCRHVVINGCILMWIGIAKREFGQRRRLDFARERDSSKEGFNGEEVSVVVFAVVLMLPVA